MSDQHEQTNDAFECNSEWLFEADKQARSYSLTVKYQSDLPPLEHDALHAWLREQATQWMIGRGLDPATCPVTIKRDHQQRHMEDESAEYLERVHCPVTAEQRVVKSA